MKRILFIEDDQDIRETAVDFFSTEGYEILTANDGAAGVQLAISNTPDIIVCDIAMPIMDGIAVYNTLKEITTTSQIPFIFLTAKAEKEDIRNGMELGVDDYITKPFEYKRLLTSIETRLAKLEKIQANKDEKFEAITENFHTGIYILYEDFLVVTNLKLSKLFGYPQKELQQHNFSSLISDEDKFEAIEEINRCKKGINLKLKINCTFLRKNGERKELSMFGKRIKWEKSYAIIGTMVEINDCNDYGTNDGFEERNQQNSDFGDDNDGNPIVLSRREKEVLKLMCDGLSNKDIASKLYLSTRTVEGHKAKLLHKTNTKSSAELVLLAIKKKIVKL